MPGDESRTRAAQTRSEKCTILRVFCRTMASTFGSEDVANRNSVEFRYTPSRTGITAINPAWR
jgi:hypothetical protein